MTQLAANALSDDYEYAIVYWGQSNARCWGDRATEGLIACPWLQRDDAGQNLTITFMYGGADAGQVGSVVTILVAENLITQLAGGELRFVRFEDGVATPTATPHAGVATILSASGVTLVVQFTTATTIPFTLDNILGVYVAPSYTYSAMATKPVTFDQFRSFQNVRVLHQWVPETPSSTPAGLPQAPGYTWPTNGNYAVTSWDQAGAFLPFTFEEGVQGFGSAGSGTLSTNTVTVDGAAWIANIYAGASVTLTASNGANYTGTIASNTSGAFTVTGSSWSPSAPANGTYSFEFSVRHWKDHPAKVSPGYGFRAPSNEPQPCTVSTVGQVYNLPRGRLTTGYHGIQYIAGSISPTINATGVARMSAGQAGQATAVGTAGTTASLPTGTSTATSATTLTDAGRAWITNQWTGAKITADGKSAIVASNTATQITVASWTGGTPASTSAYVIHALYDATQTWSTDEWAGAKVVCDSKTGTVASNTANTLILTTDWSGGTPTVVAYALIETELRTGKRAVAVLRFDHSGTNNFADGETITLTDARGLTKTFEMNSDNNTTPGNIVVPIGASADTATANLVGYINASGLRMIAVRSDFDNQTYDITLTQIDAGTSGQTTITETAAHLTVQTAFTKTGLSYLQIVRLTKSTNTNATIGRMQPTVIFRENEFVSMDLWPSVTGITSTDLAKRWTIASRTQPTGSFGGILNLRPAEGQSITDDSVHGDALYFSQVTKKVARRNVRFGAQLDTAYRLSQALGKRIHIIHLGINSSGQVWRTGPNAFGFPGTIGWWDWTKYLDWTPSDLDGNATRLKTLITKMAPAALLAEGNTKPLKILGVVGYQGEGDAISEGGRQNFARSFPTFVAWLRAVIYEAGLSLVDADRIPVVQAKITHTPWEWPTVTGYGSTFSGDTQKIINGTFTALATADPYFKAFDPPESTADKNSNSLPDLLQPGSLQYKLNGTTPFGTDPLHFNGFGEAINAKSAAEAILELHNLIMTPVTTAADLLWKAVKEDYDADGLVTLTNIRDRSATSIDDIAGIAAAQAAINLWPAYAQCVFDPTNLLHLEAGELATIAMLWRRGGSASKIEQVKWDEVWGDSGIVAKIRATGARGRQAPKSNSGVQTAPEATSGGEPVRGWSDRESMPTGLLSNRTSALDD